ncbi:MAG: TetR family transcriptional regulator [Myxococcota bacterium]|nr:TetR family transcriptional regulator [Myxococcota bacterium]
MPPRTRFTPQRILDAALRLTRRAGLRAVTARQIAAELGCSTGPVFTHFSTMEELHERLIERVISLFVAATEAPAHPDPLMAAGLGMLRFAADEPWLYESLFLTRHPWHHKWGPVRRQLATRMAAHPRYAALTDRARFGLVGRSSIVVHGLGVEIWAGRLQDAREATLLILLDQLAGPLVDAAIGNGWTNDIHPPPTGFPGPTARQEQP